MADSLDRVSRKGDVFGLLGNAPMHQPVHSDHETRIRIMAERRAAGLDLWTGEPLNVQTWKDEDD